MNEVYSAAVIAKEIAATLFFGVAIFAILKLSFTKKEKE